MRPLLLLALLGAACAHSEYQRIDNVLVRVRDNTVQACLPLEGNSPRLDTCKAVHLGETGQKLEAQMRFVPALHQQ